MKRSTALLLAGCILLTAISSLRLSAATGNDQDVLKPFLDRYTVLIIRANLHEMDTTAITAAVRETIPESGPDLTEQINVARAAVDAWLTTYRDAGGREAYLLMSLSDLSREPPFFLVVPVPEGAQPDPLRAAVNVLGLTTGSEVQRMQDCLVVSSERIATRLKSGGSEVPQNFDAAFASMLPGILQAVFLPYEGSSRVVGELMPRLPSVVGGGPSTVVTQGLLWATLNVTPPPEGALELRIQSRENRDATQLREVIVKALTAIGQMNPIQKELPQWSTIQQALTPTVAEDGLRLRLEQSQINGLAQNLLVPALSDARAKARRILLMNNLKQLALALIMYSSDNDERFPLHFADAYPYLASLQPLLPPDAPPQSTDEFERLSREDQVKWIDEQSPFALIFAGRKNTSIQKPGTTILVYQKPDSTQEPFLGAAFADGHAEILPREKALELIEASKNAESSQ